MAEGGAVAANTVLECRVCHDTFSLEGPKLPRLLQCGHTVCHSCLASLSVQQAGTTALGSQPPRLYCPFDRLPTPLTEDGGVWGLKRNFALVELLEKLQREREQLRASSQESSGSAELAVGDPYARERRLGVPCDENEVHVAVLYCVTCEAHLCRNCSEETHRPRVLARHRRVPLSEKPKPKPKCPYHSAYALEFLCQNPECAEENRLMCLLCRDYGRHSGHKHSLLDAEAGHIRQQMEEALTEFQRFSADLLEWSGRVGRGLHEIDDDGFLVRGATGGGIGTAENARRMVRQYFADLRDLLDAQESAALSVVEAHVRERVGQLRQQQEDMASLTSQVSAVCLQLEKNLKMDDAKVVAQFAEISHMIESVHKQRAQFAEIPNQVNTDSRISLTFTKDNRVHIGPKVEMRVVALGLDGAGKTTILFKMKHNEIVHAVSTIGFNVETLEYKNLKLTLWDVGGLPKLRPLWKHYYLNTQAVIFVVDSAERDRLPEVQSELVKLLAENELKDASLLVLANKQDKEGCLSSEQLSQALTLNKLCYGRSWAIQPCDALTGQGLWEGMEWLIRQLLSATVPPSVGPSSPIGSPALSIIHDV